MLFRSLESAELVDLLVGAGSLSCELVAGDIQDLQTLIVIVLVHLLDRGVLGSEAAAGRCIDDHDDFALVIREVQIPALAGFDGVIVDHILSFLFWPVLTDQNIFRPVLIDGDIFSLS